MAHHVPLDGFPRIHKAADFLGFGHQQPGADLLAIPLQPYGAPAVQQRFRKALEQQIAVRSTMTCQRITFGAGCSQEVPAASNSSMPKMTYLQLFQLPLHLNQQLLPQRIRSVARMAVLRRCA